MGEIGTVTREGRLNAGRMPDGSDPRRGLATVGPKLTVTASGGLLECRPGAPAKARATMVSSDLDAAGALLPAEPLFLPRHSGAEKPHPRRRPSRCWTLSTRYWASIPVICDSREAVSALDHTKSRELFAEGGEGDFWRKYTGHLGPAEGCFMPVPTPTRCSPLAGARGPDFLGCCMHSVTSTICAPTSPPTLGYK